MVILVKQHCRIAFYRKVSTTPMHGSIEVAELRMTKFKRGRQTSYTQRGGCPSQLKTKATMKVDAQTLSLPFKWRRMFVS